ncbi:MAG: CheR family methyltransferase [Deltaproteobacteria bacterium]|nr:CheR family methyltransferase [Deltaproteobacteria bacterium]
MPEASHLPDEFKTLGDRQFNALRDIIYKTTGIHLSDAKRSLVASRLSRRLRALRLTEFSAYVDLLGEISPDHSEWRDLINAITTNKTDFFRESHHFDFLKAEVLPQLRQRALRTGERDIRIWCAASSTGEEPYTIAITVKEAGLLLSGLNVRIIASDIDTNVLDHARAGIYDETRMSGISDALRARYFLRGTGQSAGKWKVKPELQSMIDFRRVNLVDDNWPIDSCFDIIFCRNVVIYFDKPTQKRLFDRFADRLVTGGHLFVGHSESLLGLTNRFAPIKGTVHRCLQGNEASSRKQSATVMPKRRRIVVGDVFASHEPTLVSTVLGSCVAACLYDPHARLGGMNHFLLPATLDEGPVATRFGVHAMERLINDLLNLGANRKRLKAKVFGACRVLAGGAGGVQLRNAEFIRSFLKKEGIPIEAERLGTERPLEVQFRTDTGQAFIKPLAPSTQQSIALAESQARERFAEIVAPRAGETTLF